MIDDDAAALMEMGVAVVVSVVADDLHPEITRAWGPLVSEDRRSVTMCVVVDRRLRLRAGLRAGGRLAATFSLPTSYRSLQLKGEILDVRDPSAPELARAEGHFAAFAREAVAVGVPGDAVGRFFLRPELVTATAGVREVYEQTPGPSAGARW
jgi:hypothetical protein